MNRLHGGLMDALAIAGTLEEYLTFRAENDSLTGLPNRALFYDRLETAMTRCRRSKNPMALLYLDIDHFKKVNDGLGHAAGDELLQSFSQRLLKCVRASDTGARLGGDEFHRHPGKYRLPRHGEICRRQAHSSIARAL
jgi:GGDEF domain-containing protein